MKKFTFIMCGLILLTNATFAHYEHNYNKKPNYIERIKFENMLNEKLNLSEEQKNQLRDNRLTFKKEMSKIVKQMQDLHDKIRNVYYSGIPKFQADLKTAPMKAELVLLKQKADRLKQEHRKNFYKVLTQEQKLEFEKIKISPAKKIRQ